MLTCRDRQASHQVLVVEAQEVLARSVARLLADAGYSVKVASNTDEAILMVSYGRHFNVILCELGEQDGGGATLFEWVHLFDPAQAARVVFLGEDRKSLDETCGRCGALGLAKPFTLGELLAACQRATATRGPLPRP